jgi:hypothetical protein
MLKHLSKELSNAIQWKPVPPPLNIQEYFNSNCSTNLSNENKKFDANVPGLANVCLLGPLV